MIRSRSVTRSDAANASSPAFVLALHKAIEHPRHLGGVGNLLEPKHRHVEFLERLFVNFQAIRDRQHESGRAVNGQQAGQPLEAGFFPEAENFDEYVDAGRGVNGPVIGNPHAFAAQLEKSVASEISHAVAHLAKPFDERGELGGHISAGVLQVRDQPVA